MEGDFRSCEESLLSQKSEYSGPALADESEYLSVGSQHWSFEHSEHSEPTLTDGNVPAMVRSQRRNSGHRSSKIPKLALTAEIRKNTVWGILISLIRYVYPAISFAYIARILHPEGLGRVQYAASISAYFALVTGLGMPIYGMRSVAGASDSNESKFTLLKEPQGVSLHDDGTRPATDDGRHPGLPRLAGKFCARERRQAPNSGLPCLVGELFLLRGIFGIAAFALYIIFLFYAPDLDRALLLVYGLNILSAIPECEWLYKGKGDYSVLAKLIAASRALGLAALFFLVRKETDIYTYAWISAGMAMIVALAEFAIADVKWKLRVFPNIFRILAERKVMRTAWKHIPSLTLFFLMSCAVTVYSHSDIVMLGFFKDNEAVGIYASAAKVKQFLPLITGSLWAAALPKASALWKRGDAEGFQNLACRSMRVVQAVMIPLAVYFFLFAKPCLRMLCGEDYVGAAIPMRILILAIVPIGISNIAGGQILVPAGKEKALFYSELFGALGNIIMNALLIPGLSVVGAAIATSLSETLVAIFTVMYAGRFMRLRVFDPQSIGKVAVSCLAGALSVLILFSGWPDFLVMLCSSLIFSALYGGFMLMLSDDLFLDFFRDLLRMGKKLYRKIFPEWVRVRIGKVRRGIRMAFWKAKDALFGHRGRFLCPCCGIHLKGFKDGGYIERPEIYNSSRYSGIRQDVICPACGALPRHRILADWCEAHAVQIKGDILYFALEDGMRQWFKRNGIVIHSADLNNPADLRMDMEDTGEKEGSYDWIFCNHVLEHVHDYKRALKELHRILKPGGHLICSFPIDESYDTVDDSFCPTGSDSDSSANSADSGKSVNSNNSDDEERIRRFGQVDHLRVFGRDSEELLRKAGFKVGRINGDEMREEILPVTGPADYDVNYLFLCEKEPG